MDKVKVAFIGCGSRNHVHLEKVMAIEDAEFVGFCDLVLERAEKFVKESGKGKAYTDYKTMVEQTNPDAVFIAVPPDCHGDIEFFLIDKNIPFQVEKPMALDMALAEKINAAIQAKNLIVNCAYQDTYQNLTQIMKEFLSHEQCGHVLASWCGGIPRNEWWAVKERSGGQLVEQNCHLFDQLRYLFGEPDSVYCVAHKGIVDPKVWDCDPRYNVEDCSSALIHFKNGVIANVFTGCYFRNTGCQNGITAYCVNSKAEYFLRNRLNICEGDEETDRVTTYYRGEEQTGIQDRTFVEAVKNNDGSKLLSPFSDAIKSLRLVLACNESMDTGKVINL
ncbi:MAG: Gfo/Idh/MocA family protein [Eubacteriales bacterium]